MNSYVEINLDNLKNNVSNIINKFNEYKYYIGVLKSNAYSNGFYIVNTLIESGVNYIAVSNINEAINVREYNKDIPILCLEPIDIKYMDLVIKNNITITIHSLQYLKSLNINKKVKCHIKIDSGMNRLGFKDRKEFNEAYKIISENNCLFLEGLFTHFATTGITDSFYNKQIETFKSITSDIDLNSIDIIHMGSGFDLVNHKKIDICNGIRFGTIMYGYDVSLSNYSNNRVGKLKSYRREFLMKKNNIDDIIFNTKLDLKPSLKLKSKVLQVKIINEGEIVGYGAEYTSKEKCYVATIGIGYESGIGKNSRYVIINNKRYKTVGEISMCMMSVLVDNTIKEGMEVTLIGDGISIGEYSSYKGVSFHEALICIDRSLPRVYTKNDKVVFVKE